MSKPKYYDEPATAKQKYAIARLCMALGNKDAMEQVPITKSGAARTMWQLRAQLTAKNKTIRLGHRKRASQAVPERRPI